MSDAAILTPPRAQCPALRPGVTVHPPVDNAASWIVQYGTDRYFRVSADLATLLETLAPGKSITDVAAELGGPWSSDTIEIALARIAALDLLDDGVPEPVSKARSGRRITVRPPLTVALTLFDPSKVLGRLPRAVHLLAGRIGSWAAIGVGVLGVLALAAQAAAVHTAMLQPLPIAGIYGILGAFIATSFLHEFGHGCVLVHHGGRPRRLGLMLFYLMPAFFCDVSDGWRLGRREQRVGVALAGIVTQCAVAGVAAFAALAIPAGDIRTTVLVFAVSCYLYGLLNLVPFVKLDGYIALMSHLDIPHLRAKAIADAQSFARRMLAGTNEAAQLPGRWWVVPYGLCCLVLPLFLVFGALSSWFTMFLGLGRIGGVMCLALLGFVVFHAGKGLVRFGTHLMHREFSTPRLIVVTFVLVAAITVVLTLVKVPYDVRGGYTRVDGNVELVLPVGADTSTVTPGRGVTLQRTGLALRQTVGTADVSGAGGRATVPLAAFVPVHAPGLTTHAIAFPLSDIRAADLPDAGGAIVHGGKRSVGSWLLSRYVTPVVRATLG